ncbi:PEP-CTERM sorting domain-containing protein [Sphingomonas telluris]
MSLALYEQEFRNPQPVPEPTSWAMLLLGFCGDGDCYTSVASDGCH